MFPEVEARTLYKLVDKAGKVSYSDKVPPKFDGEVTAIEIDAPPDAPREAPPSPVPATPAAKGEAAQDINAKRRANRERLQAILDAAREKVARLRQVLADGVEPRDGESQVIQQWYDVVGSRPGPKGNCSKRTTSDGKVVWLCPGTVPGEAYRERRKEVEDALGQAEAELEIAERNYRRGVD